MTFNEKTLVLKIITADETCLTLAVCLLSAAFILRQIEITERPTFSL